MNKLKLAVIATLMVVPTFAFSDIDIEYKQSSKMANQFCLANKDCLDIVAMELDALYYQGLNESRSTTMGTLINRKDRQLIDYCRHAQENLKKSCEDYRNQLMLKYITGLLDR